MSKVNRQESAKKRLEGQLKSNVKTEKGTISTKVPLTEKDVKRITKELEVLTSVLK